MKYLVLIIMVLPCLSFACIRDSDPTGGVPYKERVTEYIKNADYIFLGRIDAREWKRNPDWQNENPWHYNKISVIEQFKGSLNSPIEYWPPSSCHEAFSEVGEYFVIFGYLAAGSIQFPMNSGTISLQYANEIKLLDILRDWNE
ncbi:hypothetical protein QGM61_03800 [Pseudohongiella sp. SYSU M77423]|uniref:hypothetical protein n=1 Tax=Pseudohongiella sp. SYSU M77423 TaxID=3042312 RepID=UPI0024816C40|nr:hypothetical protein [Pseudohongiella sp. SYSU M77423]MDH7942936.1 hypothetical protein [Pseudohongiella sp. SYSU M77423]